LATTIDDAVTGQRLSIVAASANHSAATAVSAGDNNDNNDEANKPSTWAGMDADGGGRQQPDDRLGKRHLVIFPERYNIYNRRFICFVSLS
jgi:hypothetical protein